MTFLLGFLLGFFLCMGIMGYLGKKELDRRDARLHQKLSKRRYGRSI